jgi:antitoxin (DNA-binding transcriptional repressor) of toxin-antitoxin stability system
MALKADRHVETTDISFFYNEGTATRGGVVVYCHQNTASGAAVDQGANLVKYKTPVATDVPVGILLNDVVNKDLTRTHLNEHKDEVQKGGKVTIMTRGTVVTNMVTGTPTPGAVAYASTTGTLGTSAAIGAASGNLAVGRWMSRKDADGYAKVSVNLPNFGGNDPVID